ncbi:MAG: excisionase family DNA-binding protein [Micropruina sp.]|uniref:excisionase family DNA-binding protein n=1 Tax=Micropruina sp. TaxID=2737536 RepID=UPI0039E313B1
MATARDARLARDVLEQLEGSEGALAVERDGRLVLEVPPEIGKLLQQVLDVVARGGTVTIGSVPPVLTTSTAAGILGISRPTLMKMINEGTIGSHMVGTHHRLKADDVFAALRARRARERAAFAELMELEGDEE